MIGRVLIVAGSDSGGGAGIQADVKTVSALGGYAMTAVTALTAQNTLGVQDILPVPPDFVARQMQAVLADIGADAVKTGMLGDAATIEAVCGVLERDAPSVPLVVDPVMLAKGGRALLAPAALEILLRRMLPLAALITPNIPEAEALTGIAISDETAMRRAAEKLLGLGARAVLVKGGHLPGDELSDVLASPDGTEVFASTRVPTRHTHGTGCTLASALACCLAQGTGLRAAVLRARAYVRTAITQAPGFGCGHGPLGYPVPPWAG